MTRPHEFGVAVNRAQAKYVARIFRVPLWAVWSPGPKPLCIDGREYARRRAARKRRRR